MFTQSIAMQLSFSLFIDLFLVIKKAGNGSEDPWWVTLLAIIVFFACLPFFIERDVKRMREEDERYAARKGWTLEQLHEYRDKRRARTIRGSVRKDVMARDNYQCQYCGATDDLAIDHIFPFSRGGSNEADNLQVLCRACNSAKSDAIPREYSDNS